MSTDLFSQNIIAIVWDFDKTVIPGYMQAPLFKKFGIDEKVWWFENNKEAQNLHSPERRVNPDVYYLSRMLKQIESGEMPGITRKDLKSLGSEIRFFDGFEDLLKESKQWVLGKPYSDHDIRLEHYIVTTGIADIVRGTGIIDEISEIWGCEFEEENGVIKWITYTIDNTTKTKALFEINKGVNKHPDKIQVNTLMKKEHRRVPFEHMIYVADGPSDIPAFSVLKREGGVGICCI